MAFDNRLQIWAASLVAFLKKHEKLFRVQNITKTALL